jgi:hypothetical protein
MRRRLLRVGLSLLLLVAGSGCKEAADSGEAATGVAAAGSPPRGPQTPPPTAPEKVRKPPEPKDDCLGMYRLLLECSGNPRLRSDGHFKRTFLNNCRGETSRETGYATRFAECTRAADCETLDKCSRALDAAAAELGPEQVRYLLDNNQRSTAAKFCYDNGRAVEASAELHDLCHPLLEEIESEKAAAGDHGGCPFHGH